MPVQKEFVTNADGCGDHIFTQLKRTGNVCLYRRNRTIDGSVAGFEVFIAKTILAGAKLPGNAVVENDYEPYPGKGSFGKTAWSYGRHHLVPAENKFDEVIKKNDDKDVDVEHKPVMMGFVTSTPKVSVENETENIPAGEFTMVEFATANGLPPRGVVYNILHSLIARGLVKESRRVSYGRGRPTCLFIKA
jgi:hypothetical protein